ncbi:hypoxanthine phosphoribosyltransferase [Flammeovirga kamogawensis]|uniref:Hypoxanthine phosphoribosyltransferase n=1 Tax=Flammeovirga kamogawensis TaxID=373891 RepID=A0ABX8GZA7_9BACT|nr:hypoxanthine phosphoribosyltransferase [Flammeovirga kamogawensis]MBB6459182.1 hypoxanthine phosphoribosyltransferase [Flammeovirga kamogawensis]QWG08748.1 hypoxanthine phosphoribosyltransferase [Flammeovirga kamogawensis]TRX67041.1 hypoxanthine phosphoribosyltransferase [Flammeovirga kamogawensis]
MAKVTKVLDKEFVPFIGKEQIAERNRQLGAEITKEYQGKDVLMISVLNGSFMFASDLVKEIDLPMDLSFVKYASYEGTESTGKVKQLIGFNAQAVKDKHIVIIEDIVDTGRTMQALIKDLEVMEPASVKVVSLLFKPEALKIPMTIDYVGFEIDPKFVVGYGLDYDGFGRNIPEILVLKDI